MFEKSLSDLVRGIRNNKKNEAKYISQCIQEIKEELKQDMAKKTVAIQKLTYLQMLGYDMSWAAFNVIEVMSQQRFTSKRIGYLAAAQSFHEGTEVVMLATNLLKKDFNSQNQYESGLAINSLANICTPDLARDLASDIVALMSNSKPYIRKKAVLVMYKVFLKFPDSLRPSFPKLKDKLDDSDQSVISAAVNVICELARKNPKNYLALAPVLFKLLTSNYNNWMLIKIIKLFGALTPYEPRLAKKLVEPLSNLINTTPAMSLIYECIQTCTIGMAEHLPIIKLCTAKLRTFVEDPDQNLKYLGLLAMNNIMKIHPKAVAEHRDLVLNCLDDEDVTIRLRALELLTGMVTKRNLPEIVRKLVEHVERAEGTYRDELVNKIIQLCSQSSYAYITDFEWYITVLVQLTHVHGTTHGSLIASQVLDVVIRVKVVRPFGVKQMTAVLRESRLLSNPEPNGVCEVLYAAAWIVGEFARYVESPVEAIDALLHPRAAVLPAHIQSIYMHSVLKLFSFLVAAAYNNVAAEEGVEGGDEVIDVSPEMITEASNLITTRLQVFAQSVHLEVQERACFVLEVLRLYNNLKTDETLSAELAALFEEPLNPVAKGAIKKVPVPEGLDLDTPLNDEPPEEVEEEEPPAVFVNEEEEEEEEEGNSSHKAISHNGEDEDEDGFWEKPSKKKEAPAKKSTRPESVFILKSRPKQATAEEQVIPIVPLAQNALGSLTVGSPKKPAIGVKKVTKAYTVDTTEELPEGALAGSDEDDKKKKATGTGKRSGADALSEISLAGPLKDYEQLPVSTHRVVEQPKEKARQARGESEKPPEGERRRRPTRPEEGGGERRRRPIQTEGQLIDIGGDETPQNQTAVAPVEDYQELGSPASGAQQEVPRRRRPEGERPHRPDGERHRRPRPEGSERRPRPEGERRPRPDGERRPRPEGERERRPRPEGSGGGERPRRPAGREGLTDSGGSATLSSRSAKFKPLFDGDDLRAAYDLRANVAERGKLNVFFIIANKTDTDIGQVTINFSDTMNVRLARESPGAPSQVSDKIDATQRVQHQLTLLVGDISKPQRVKGVVSYEYLGDIRKAEFTFIAPVGSFVGGITQSEGQFSDIVTGEARSLPTPVAKVKLIGDFKSTVNAIIDAVHVDIVQLSPGVASAYGKSLRGDHVCLLIKELPSEGVVSVGVKTEDTLGLAIVQELNAIRQ